MTLTSTVMLKQCVTYLKRSRLFTRPLLTLIFLAPGLFVPENLSCLGRHPIILFLSETCVAMSVAPSSGIERHSPPSFDIPQRDAIVYRRPCQLLKQSDSNVSLQMASLACQDISACPPPEVYSSLNSTRAGYQQA